MYGYWKRRILSNTNSYSVLKCYYLEMSIFRFFFKKFSTLMRNYFPKRTSGAPLHTLSKLYDVPVGFVPLPLFWGSVLLYLRSPKCCCYSISDDLSSFNITKLWHICARKCPSSGTYQWINKGNTQKWCASQTFYSDVYITSSSSSFQSNGCGPHVFIVERRYWRSRTFPSLTCDSTYYKRTIFEWNQKVCSTTDGI